MVNVFQNWLEISNMFSVSSDWIVWNKKKKNHTHDMPFSVKSVSFNCQKSTDWIWLPANSVDSIQTVNQCKNHVVYSSLQASKAQISVPLWRTFIVFLLKSPIITNSMTVSFCAAFYQLIHHFWHVGPQVVVHGESISGYPLVDVVLWGRCGPTAVRVPNQRHFFLKDTLWPGIPQ